MEVLGRGSTVRYLNVYIVGIWRTFLGRGGSVTFVEGWGFEYFVLGGPGRFVAKIIIPKLSLIIQVNFYYTFMTFMDF